MYYVGIDVGQNEYFIIVYSKLSNQLLQLKVSNISELFNERPHITSLNSIIAIDAPSNCACEYSSPRECESAVGIVGYFQAPHMEKDAKPWMISGFNLWQELIDKHGYQKYGNLIEVHPTIIFKKIMNLGCSDPKKWIRLEHPKTKRRREGKIQRKAFLKKLLPHITGNSIDCLNIDFVDALIAAYTAEQFRSKNVISFGNKKDGLLWFPDKPTN